jgi:hypothetical protein
MARLDPRTYPDRLAFEAHARKLRGAELDRLSGAASAWFARQREELAGGIARLIAGTGSHSHR